MIRAGGAVLWRRRPDGGVEVAVIHRPRYDDWSLPKGKVDQGESVLEAAVREVHEKTGQRAHPGAPVGEVRYRVGDRDKSVRYWAMEAQGGDFTPGREVDEVRWLPPEEAARTVTRPDDQALLQQFSATYSDYVGE